MTIECRFFGPLRDAVEAKTVTVEMDDGAVVADVVDRLVEDYPDLAAGLLAEDGNVHDGVNVTLNKENINHLNGADTSLEDGDVLRFASAVIGGSQ